MDALADTLGSRQQWPRNESLYTTRIARTSSHHRRKMTQRTAARARTHARTHSHTKWQHVLHTLTGRVLKFIILPSEVINYGMRELFLRTRRCKNFPRRQTLLFPSFLPTEEEAMKFTCWCKRPIRFLGWRTVGLHVCGNISGDVIFFFCL